MRHAPALVGITLSIAACGEGSGPSSSATQLAFSVQPTGTVAGQPMSPAVRVSIQDASGNLVGSAASPITLTIDANPSAGALSGTTTVNAAGGVAAFSDLRVDKPGTGYTLSATASGLTGTTSSAFDVTPAPGVAAAMAPLNGDHQTATVGEAVATSPSVKITDGLGDPVASVIVTFSVGGGGGTASGVERTTDAGGVATVGGWTLGTVAGLNSLLATSAGLQGSPVTFSATAVAGPAFALTNNSSAEQETTVGSTVMERPSVRATDAYGNPVADVAVTFAVQSGGGSITGPSQVTASNGIATVGSWTLGNTPGPNALTATSPGLSGSPVTFHATAMAFPTAVTVKVFSNYFQSVRNGSGGNPGLFGSVAVDTIGVGGTVTWQWAGSGHNVTPTTGFASSGTHDAPFTFGPITLSTAGTYAYRCTIHSHVLAPFGLVGMRGQIVVR